MIDKVVSVPSVLARMGGIKGSQTSLRAVVYFSFFHEKRGRLKGLVLDGIGVNCIISRHFALEHGAEGFILLKKFFAKTDYKRSQRL